MIARLRPALDRAVETAKRWHAVAEPVARPWIERLKAACAFSPQPGAPDGAGPLARLAASYPLPTWRPLARLVVAFIALFLLWALVADLDEIAVANGEVVPEGKVKVIQHLEGGIVRDIYVSEGSEVKEGTPLVQLDLAVTALNANEIQARLDGLMLQKTRLLAEVAGRTSVDFPAEESARQPDIVAAERRSFEARLDALQRSLAVLRDQARQKELEITELSTREQALVNSLKLGHQRLAMSADLLKSGLTARMEHVQLQGQVEETEGQLATVRASIPRARAGLAEAQQRIGEEQSKFVRTAQGELATAEIDIARNRQQFTQASGQQFRTQITSPTEGVVKNLRNNTIGGVIRAGDPIMEIVPINERLQVEVRLSPADRGYVRIGQRATVKISAYDYTTYGGLDGEVILVAPDTTIQPDTEPYYRVVVRADKAWIGDAGEKRPITAGMQATAEIHTGERTVMEYLVKPVLKLRHEAFHER